VDDQAGPTASHVGHRVGWVRRHSDVVARMGCSTVGAAPSVVTVRLGQTLAQPIRVVRSGRNGRLRRWQCPAGQTEVSVALPTELPRRAAPPLTRENGLAAWSTSVSQWCSGARVQDSICAALAEIASGCAGPVPTNVGQRRRSPGFVAGKWLCSTGCGAFRGDRPHLNFAASERKG
jgi:hypothetical protein